MPEFIYRDIDHVGFGYADDLLRIFKARGFDADLDRDGGIADLAYLGIKADQIADKDRFVKNHFADRGGDKAAMVGLPDGFDRARLIDIAEDHAAEDRALRIGHVRHHRNADRRI